MYLKLISEKETGIQEGMAVVTTDGLIGTVIRAFEFSANVQLISNINDQSVNSIGISATSLEHPESFGVIESYDHEIRRVDHEKD